MTGVDAEPLNYEDLVNENVAEKWIVLPLVGRQGGSDYSCHLFVCLKEKWFYVNPVSFGLLGAIPTVLLRNKIIEKDDASATVYGLRSLCVCRVVGSEEDRVSILRACLRNETGEDCYELLDDGLFFQKKTKLIYLPLEKYDASKKPTAKEVFLMMKTEKIHGMQTQFEDPYFVPLDPIVVQQLMVEVSSKSISFYSKVLLDSAREFDIACGVCWMVGRMEEDEGLRTRFKEVCEDYEDKFFNPLKDFRSAAKYQGFFEFSRDALVPLVLEDNNFQRFDTFSDHLPDAFFEEIESNAIDCLFKDEINQNKYLKRKLKGMGLARQSIDDAYIKRLVKDLGSMAPRSLIDEGIYCELVKSYFEKKHSEYLEEKGINPDEEEVDRNSTTSQETRVYAKGVRKDD